MTRPQVGDIIRFGEYGTAQAQHVLDGYTIGTDDGVIEGTMPNNGIVTITPNTADQALSGHYASGSKVVGDGDLIAANIRKGKNIFGITGTFDAVEVTAGDAVEIYDGGNVANFTYKEYTRTVRRTLGKMFGTVRIGTSLQSAYSNNTVYAQLYKNGVPYGTAWSTNSTGTQNFSRDVPCEPGDVFEMYVKNSSSKGSGGALRIHVASAPWLSTS